MQSALIEHDVQPEDTLVFLHIPKTGGITLGAFIDPMWLPGARCPEYLTYPLARLINGEGPYLRTGDLGFLKDGELYITGHLKDVIIVNGRNLLAADFETVAASAHPSLQPGAVAAFGVTIDGEEKVVIMHETQPGQENVDVEEVARQIRRAVSGKIGLPLYAVVLVKPGSLPRTGSGKIQRYLCRSRYLESLSD